MKIGVLGGTFNPIHVAHVRIAEHYAEQLGLDRMILVPTYFPPHKQVRHLANARQRIEMCRLAVQELPIFSVCEFEAAQKGTSYTYRTLDYLQAQYPESALYLIMGGDMFLTVQDWTYIEQIFRLTTLCTAPRVPGELALLKAHRRKLEQMGAACMIIDLPAMPLSSTLIRDKLFAGEDVSAFLHPAVDQYIKTHKLYQK